MGVSVAVAVFVAAEFTLPPPIPPQAAIKVKVPTAQALRRQEKWADAVWFGLVFMFSP